MAELTIRLRRDPQTGKHDIIITLKSDQDALPMEHEQMHRELVAKIIGPDRVGQVIIEREPGREALTSSPAQSIAQPEAENMKA